MGVFDFLIAQWGSDFASPVLAAPGARRGNFTAATAHRDKAAPPASHLSFLLEEVKLPRMLTQSMIPKGYFTKQGKDLGDKLIESIQHMMDRPKIIRSVCRTHSE